MEVESQIIRAPSVLVFGNRALDRTIEKITLLTYAVRLNLPFKYQVMDYPSAYNALLERQWMYRIKAVPYNFHQLVKFQTPWGVQQINGDQRIASECYLKTLKPSSV
ncbi:hypothetical protein K1719_040328 [Acacia pycnantha]|nr:hypothetical protein K1719_046817 [Acacia pycnantha]KAI9077722.1 hypothetical protein K1719_040328 [Acacia pycnantha]